jgi:hypothetical protein
MFQIHASVSALLEGVSRSPQLPLRQWLVVATIFEPTSGSSRQCYSSAFVRSTEPFYRQSP